VKEERDLDIDSAIGVFDDDLSVDLGTSFFWLPAESSVVILLTLDSSQLSDPVDSSGKSSMSGWRWIVSGLMTGLAGKVTLPRGGSSTLSLCLRAVLVDVEDNWNL
jgi:hypothetical protein